MSTRKCATSKPRGPTQAWSQSKTQHRAPDHKRLPGWKSPWTRTGDDAAPPAGAGSGEEKWAQRSSRQAGRNPGAGRACRPARAVAAEAIRARSRDPARRGDPGSSRNSSQSAPADWGSRAGTGAPAPASQSKRTRWSARTLFLRAGSNPGQSLTTHDRESSDSRAVLVGQPALSRAMVRRPSAAP